MSNLFKALKRAEQERQNFRQDRAGQQAEMPLQAAGEVAPDAQANPLRGEQAAVLPPGPGSAPPQVTITAMLIVTALSIVLAGNFGYWLRGRGAVAPVAHAVAVAPAGGGVPLVLLTGDAAPLQLRLDRRTDWEGSAPAR